jgi:hypothetical protein
MIKIRDTLEKRVKRSERSWYFIYFAFSISVALVLFIIGIAPSSATNKVIIFFTALIVLIQLFFFNGWFQNKLVCLKIKIEEAWRKT